MREQISDFIASKSVSEPTKQAYRYDLEHFCSQVTLPVTPGELALYQRSLEVLKPSVRQRKASSINQFLRFLYQKNRLDYYIQLPKQVFPQKQEVVPHFQEDVSILLEDSPHASGQLMAILAAYMGLGVSDVLQLSWQSIALDIGVLTAGGKTKKRVLKTPEPLLPFLIGWPSKKGYVFGGDRIYSRQWAYKTLQVYFISIGKPHWSMRYLRKHYIYQSLSAGISPDTLARQLGISHITSLEMYQRWILH